MDILSAGHCGGADWPRLLAGGVVTGLRSGCAFSAQLAERGILAAHEGGDQALRAAYALLHGIGILAVAKQLRALQAGERV